MNNENNPGLNTNLHVVTAAELEEFGALLWTAMKRYVLEGQETSPLAIQVAALLDEINHEIINGNLREKANAIKESVQHIYSVLDNAGTDINHLKLRQVADIIRDLTASYEICILDKDDKKWTPGEWESYKEEHGTEPSDGAVVAVITPYQSFVVAPTWVNKQYGIYNRTVPGLYGAQTGSFVNVLQNSLQFKGLENTRLTLLYANPEKLPHIEYDPDDDTINYANYMCVRFASYQQMLDSGIHNTYTEQVYVVTADEHTPAADGTPTANMAYYWDGGQYVQRFVVPLYDTQKITGAPAAEHAWAYEAWPGDLRQWHLPLINHLLILFAYYSEVNKCLYVIRRSPLPTSNCWTGQESSATYQYGVVIPSGQVNYNFKNFSYAVLAVAALQKTKSL